MNENLNDALEICLQEIENGAEIETALMRFPDLADELRPILEASVQARALSAPQPSAEVVRKNRAKVLQRAAEMREVKTRSVRRWNWIAPLRRLATTLAVLALVFASGTSLVGAAAASLPGDDLYPVKRSWEDLQLFFAFDAHVRKALEVKNENERLSELRELVADKRSAEVAFSGLVTRQSQTGWLVAGVPVTISPETTLPSQPVQTNSAVRVVALIQADGSTLALEIRLLPPDASLPDVDDQDVVDADEDEPDSPSEDDAPEVVKFDGTLDVLNTNFWTINGVQADITHAQVEGVPAVGAEVTVEGYFNESGAFIVSKIKFQEVESDDGDGANSNDDGDQDNDDNDNDDNDDDNEDNDD